MPDIPPAGRAEMWGKGDNLNAGWSYSRSHQPFWFAHEYRDAGPAVLKLKKFQFITKAG